MGTPKAGDVAVSETRTKMPTPRTPVMAVATTRNMRRHLPSLPPRPTSAFSTMRTSFRK